jgi:branched-chain amino acid transport system ATP-binding protein
MLEPDCILLDEPTAGVNPALADSILDRIMSMRKDGTTVVIIEHDMSVIQSVADEVTVFDQGQIIARGPFDEVANQTAVQEAYLGKEQDEVDSLL